MIELKGKYNTAKIYTDNVDSKSKGQIIDLLSREAFKDSKIRIMPDVHAGAGCVIGFTMELKDKVVPNLVGVDIGCGVLTIKIKEKDIDFKKLDEVIRKEVPHGFSVHDTPNNVRNMKASNLNVKRTFADVDVERAEKSIGTLGGGNHFIEVGRDDEDYLYIFIHTGSRKFGLEIAKYHQKIAKETSPGEELSYLTDYRATDYLYDMDIAQKYAKENRVSIGSTIVRAMNFNIEDSFDTVHNYINMEDRILRKGAVSAHKGERLVIPLNMRDGVILAEGKGNEDWNYTAPHGAGRIYSRSRAKRELSLKDFEQEMEGVYSTSVSSKTLDESPMAYKEMSEIVDAVGDTVNIKKIIKPVYNFKA